MNQLRLFRVTNLINSSHKYLSACTRNRNGDNIFTRKESRSYTKYVKSLDFKKRYYQLLFMLANIIVVCFNSYTYQGNFSYKNDAINFFKITDDLEVRIERKTQDIAALYFVNGEGTRIPIPNNAIFKNVLYNENIVPYKEYFLLTWFSNYTLFLNNNEVLSLENQKQQAIKGPRILSAGIIL